MTLEGVQQEMIQENIYLIRVIPLLLWALLHVKAMKIMDDIKKDRDPEIITFHDLTFIGMHENLILNGLFLFGYVYIAFVFVI